MKFGFGKMPPGLKNFVMMSYLKSLIKSDTGDSSKSFFLVMVTIVGFILLLIVGFVMVYDVIVSGMVMTDLYGLATVIASVTSLFGAAGLCKVVSEKNELRYPGRRNLTGTTRTGGIGTANRTAAGGLGSELLNRVSPLSRRQNTTTTTTTSRAVKEDEGSVFDQDFSNDDD